MIDFGKEAIFEVSVIRGKSRNNMMRGDNIQNDENAENKDQANDDDNIAQIGDGLATRKNISEIGLVENNEEQDFNLSFRSEKSNYESDNEMKNHRQYEEQYDYENDSNKSGLIDDGTMNLFGFNDDLNLDDRIIILNATDNNIYNVVERPKYLLQFDQKDLEQEFLFSISKQEANRTTMYLVLLIILNKIIVMGDQILDGKFTYTPQFILMFPIFIFELLLCYKLNNPEFATIQIWTGILHLYALVVLGVLLSLQVKYLGKWTQAGFNEL